MIPDNAEDVKLGIYEKAMPGGMGWGERLDTAARAGYRFVEMSVDETDERLARLDWDYAARRRFVEDTAGRDAGVPSMCLSAHRRFPLGSHDPEVRAEARMITRKAVQLALDTGIRTIQLAGYDVYYEEGDEDTRAWFLEGLHEAVDLAGRENVMLAVEIMDHPLMRSILRYLNIYDDFRSPWFKVYPDLGNLSAWGADVCQELRLGIEHIVAIHLKDTHAVRPGFPGKFKGVPFGEGCVDFPSAFAVLRELRFSGPFLIEMWTEKSEDPVEEIRRARCWILERMREGGYGAGLRNEG